MITSGGDVCFGFILFYLLQNRSKGVFGLNDLARNQFDPKKTGYNPAK